MAYITDKEYRQFREAYIDCLLWSSTDDNEEPLDQNYDRNDLAQEALDTIDTDCKKFLTLAIEMLDDCTHTYDSRWDIMELAGHDFWLTHNGHGAGFWDGDWTHEEIESVGDKLTDLAKQFPEQSPYAGDDGLIYLF